MIALGPCIWLLPSPPPRPQAAPGQVVFSEYGIETAAGAEQALPQQFVDTSRPYTPPILPRVATAQECLVRGGSSEAAFLDCIAESAMSESQQRAYKCLRANKDPNQLALCLIGSNLGNREAQAFSEAQRCYAQHGTNWKMYALCMKASTYISDDKVALAVDCLQRGIAGNSSMWAIGMCYAGPQLGKMNTESAIAMECAMSSGGQPMAFVGCTGGRLTAIELSKCLTGGVGKPGGCFGPGNDLYKSLQAIGEAAASQFGPNNDITKAVTNTFNDLTRGPGKNNDVVKALDAVNKGLQLPKLVEAANKALPGVKIKIKKPRVTIKW